MAKKETKNKVNLNHIKFAQHYAEKGNATQAYLFAYGPDITYGSARELGSNLLTNVDVQALIEQYKEELAMKFSVSRESLVKDLLEIKDAQKTDNAQAAIKAIEVISKMLGYNAPDKIEHSGNLPITVIKTIEVRKDNE